MLYKKHPRRFFVSDTHWNHRNVIPYCNRPYSSVEEMNEAMLKIWNDTVSKDDIVYFLGDLDINGMRSFKELSHLLNGKKILISGNHDATFQHQKTGLSQRTRNKIQRVLEYGWESVHQTVLIKLSNGETVLLSHLPYLDEDSGKYDLRYKKMRPLDGGYKLIHGHLHARYLKKGNMIDVGFDGKLGLYSEDEVIELLNDERDFIPSRLTEFYNASKPRVMED